jgi:hypothetical protein
MTLVPQTDSSTEHALGSSSAAFGAMTTTGTRGQYLYGLVADQDMYYSQGATPTASIGNDSIFLQKGAVAVLDGIDGTQVAVLEAGTAGHAFLFAYAKAG